MMIGLPAMSGFDVARQIRANPELRGVTLQLTNPRARLSRSESRGKVFSALGEAPLVPVWEQRHGPD